MTEHPVEHRHEAGTSTPPPSPARHDEPEESRRERAAARLRTNTAYAALAAGLLLAIAVVVFIVQNLQTVHFDFIALHGEFPLAVGLLLAAVCGALAVFIPGSVRIIQLRRTARRHRKR